MTNKGNNDQYQFLVQRILDTYEKGMAASYRAVNRNLLETYWEIGRYIVEFEQGGKVKAEYGKTLLQSLSKDLSFLHGKGFSRSNLSRMRQLYAQYPICATVSHKLSWSHYVELLKIDDPFERSFYEKQCLLENWNIKEFQRQKKSSLFLRLAASKDKQGILQLSKKGQIVQQPSDLIREPYILELKKIPEPYHLSESELEKTPH